MSLVEQREMILPRDTRYVEFVVTESVYNSFLRRKAETGVDYVEWVKLHIDLMNRMAENATPGSGMKTKIARVIVINDGFKTNPIPNTKDIDGSWFNDKDYRVNQDKETGQGYFWSFEHTASGGLSFSFPAGEWNGYKPKVIYPKKDDSFETVRDGVWVDCGLTHELGHQAWNLPDEYILGFEDSVFSIRKFIYYSGSLHEPEMSPYLSSLLKLFVREGIRGYYTDPRGIGIARTLGEKFFHYHMIPEKITLKSEGITEAIFYSNIYREPDYYLPKEFKEVDRMKKMPSADLVIPRSVFEPQALEKGEMYPLFSVIRIKRNNQWEELFLPVSIFNMAKIAGIDNAICNLQFYDKSFSSDRQSFQFQMIDGTKMNEFMEFRRKNNFLPFATLKIDGLSTWFVWSLQK